MDEYRKLHEFREIIPLSARKHEGLEVLLDKVLRFLPEGPRYFPEDQVTDQPVRFMVAEIIREQVLVETEEEVPYATTVVIEQFEEGTKVTRIAAMIYCERSGQKGIPGAKAGRCSRRRHRGPAADRKDAGEAGFSRAFRQGPRKLAGVARVCRGPRLAPPGGSPRRHREAMSRSHLAHMQ
jgi:GTP-binding protein Era